VTATRAARSGPALRAPRTTPRMLGLTMVGLVVAALAWGAVGAWTIGTHASAAQDVVHTSEPVSFEARQMYQSLSDADVTATTAFLSGPSESLAMRRRYEADIAQASTDLSQVKEATAGSGSAQLTASLAAVTTGLPVYTGYVAEAQSDYALGYQLTGGSFMQVASEEMHLTLLPAARTIYAQANASLAARSAQATGLPWIVVLLVLSALLWFALYRVQRWLSARTRRTFNLGLLAGSVLLSIAAVWLLIAFAVARSDLGSAEAHGSAPAQALAQATITVQRARGDEILNLISRSGSTSFQADFAAARQQVGPGTGSLLDAAAFASSGTATGSIIAAGRDAQAFYAAGSRVFSLDLAANYAAETSLVIGSGPGSSAAGFAVLERDLGAAIAADQAVFSSGATAAAGAYGGLEIAFVVAALLMAAGCAWGLSQRLAEYQ
jgi:ABC-type multidrug transport system fused ATPase/permease subunit